eukprot:TRINITY_DN51790_c0_g1_i1.p2 TRINITY_DN51790_c0_g1~~TRINITY_DN51790_c0_g1_i1.p2  ORF type:complete len:221 (+),score=10.82 TRINITY_DN51790_c0_g1_i1:88-663(+)
MAPYRSPHLRSSSESAGTDSTATGSPRSALTGLRTLDKNFRSASEAHLCTERPELLESPTRSPTRPFPMQSMGQFDCRQSSTSRRSNRSHSTSGSSSRYSTRTRPALLADSAANAKRQSPPQEDDSDFMRICLGKMGDPRPFTGIWRPVLHKEQGRSENGANGLPVCPKERYKALLGRLGTMMPDAAAAGA